MYFWMDIHLEQTFAVFCRPWTDNLKTRNLTIPRGVVLRVLSRYTSGRAVWTSENNRTRYITTRHVIGLSSRVHDLVNGLHGEVECHELATTRHRVSDARIVLRQASYTGFRPPNAEPTARPAKPISVIGVSTTRFSPNLSSRPLVT